MRPTTEAFDTEARAAAIRAMLRSPLLHRSDDDEAFREVASRKAVLISWFRDNLGWLLVVDVRAGVARLHKRTAYPSARRGLVTRRSTPRPFGRFQYQLLSLTCAQMLRRPHSTLGDLADALARLCSSAPQLQTLDITKVDHRRAFIDVLLWLIDVGALYVTAGEVEGYAASRETNAVLRANTSTLPLLLSCDTPPSRLDVASDSSSPADWIAQLSAEPRYGSASTDPETTETALRNRWSRHTALRALLDDPVVDLEALPTTVRNYLATSSGRSKALAVAQEAGFVVERHAEVWLAIDPTGQSSPHRFSPSGRGSKVQQAAGLVLSVLVPASTECRKRIIRSRRAVEAAVEDALSKNPAWAKSDRKDGGPQALCSAALELLEEFGLVRQQGDQVIPRPAAARFAVQVET